MFDRHLKCGRVTINDSPELDLCHSGDQKTAFYNGLMHCGNVWVCPDCSSRVAASRCEEIKKAIAQHTLSGGDVVMLTFTCQHSLQDCLGDLINSQSKAFERFWRSGSVVRLLKKHGVIGRITSVEVTVSKVNGWHPHRHILLFLDKKHSVAEYIELEHKLQEFWYSALVANSLTARLDIGLSLDGADDNDNEKYQRYLTKFAQELSLSTCKRGKKSGHYNAFALLDIKESDPLYFWACTRYLEYAETMKGRRQIIWSPGLKMRFLIDDVSDEEILNNPADREYVARVSKDGFALLPDEVRIDILAIAASVVDPAMRRRALASAFELVKRRYGVMFYFYPVPSPADIEAVKNSRLRIAYKNLKHRASVHNAFKIINADWERNRERVQMELALK